MLYRRKRYDMIQIFKPIHGFDDYNCDKLFQFNVNCICGHIYRIEKPRCMKSLHLNAFLARAIDNWNNLDEEIILCEIVQSFSSSLDIAWSDSRFNLKDIYS